MEHKVFEGEYCVRNNAAFLLNGSKPLIVTGKNSARVSGALADVTESVGTDYVIFDGITENPPLETCVEAGKTAKENGCDCIIAIGGGSVIDGAKAIAVYAVDPGLGTEIYNIPQDFPALKLTAIPLTVGTGSEANKSSVLTYNGKKKSVVKDCLLPTAAFLDPRYVSTLSGKQLTSTAIDAFCHCIESYLSPKSTAETRRDAAEGGKILWNAFSSCNLSLGGKGLDTEKRAELQKAAYLGGKAIMTTGTGFTHPLGYAVTLEYGVPHGFACGCFTGKYIELNMSTDEGKRLICEFAGNAGTTPEMIAACITALSDVNIHLTQTEIDNFTAGSSGAKNYVNSPFCLDDETAKDIYTELFS